MNAENAARARSEQVLYTGSYGESYTVSSTRSASREPRCHVPGRSWRCKYTSLLYRQAPGSGQAHRASRKGRVNFTHETKNT